MCQTLLRELIKVVCVSLNSNGIHRKLEMFLTRTGCFREWSHRELRLHIAGSENRCSPEFHHVIVCEFVSGRFKFTFCRQILQKLLIDIKLFGTFFPFYKRTILISGLAASPAI